MMIGSGSGSEKIMHLIKPNTIGAEIGVWKGKTSIEFLKKRFDLQSDLNIGSYNLNLNSRQISREGVKLSLTEREGNLIIFLNHLKTLFLILQIIRPVLSQTKLCV